MKKVALFILPCFLYIFTNAAFADIALIRAAYCRGVLEAQDEIMLEVLKDANDPTRSDAKFLRQWVSEHERKKQLLLSVLASRHETDPQAVNWLNQLKVVGAQDMGQDAAARLDCRLTQKKNCPISAATRRLQQCTDLSWAK